MFNKNAFISDQSHINKQKAVNDSRRLMRVFLCFKIMSSDMYINKIDLTITANICLRAEQTDVKLQKGHKNFTATAKKNHRNKLNYNISASSNRPIRSCT